MQKVFIKLDLAKNLMPRMSDFSKFVPLFLLRYLSQNSYLLCRFILCSIPIFYPQQKMTFFLAKNLNLDLLLLRQIENTRFMLTASQTQRYISDKKICFSIWLSKSLKSLLGNLEKLLQMLAMLFWIFIANTQRNLDHTQVYALQKLWL